MSKDLALQNIEWYVHETPNNHIPLEFTEEIKPETFGLEITEANQLLGGIDIITAELSILKNAYVDVISLEITSENQPVFKDLRKSFTKNRTSREKLRKAKKSYFLNGGRFIDAIFKNIDAECELMESKLLEAEKFFENQEKEKALVLNKERIEKLRPYVEDADKLDLSAMNDYDFDDFLLGKKTRFEAEALAKIEAEKKAEAEAKEKEIHISRTLLLSPYFSFIKEQDKDRNWGKFDQETFDNILNKYKNLKEEADKKQKAIEAENAKLKAEAEAKEKALELERKAQAEKEAKIKAENEAKLKAEQQAKSKLEAELQAKKEAELKAENERLAKLEAEKAEAESLAKAPIKQQLSSWLDNFLVPECTVKNETVLLIVQKHYAFKKWAKDEIEKI
jgi:hypothetical protein